MFHLYFNRYIFHFFLLGVSSGIPFLLILSTLSFRLTECKISPSMIGLFTLVTLPYCVKFLWAPFLDRFANNFFKCRYLGYKIWGVIAQVGLIVSTLLLGSFDPMQQLGAVAITAFALSFFAASQDIVIDVLRVELLASKQIGAGAAIESIGFRCGMLIGGAGALYLASLYDWCIAYWIMAGIQILGIPALWFVPVKTFSTAFIPIVSFAQTLKVSFQSLYKETPFKYLILFILFFKVADTVLNAMSAPFLYDLSFNKIEYANITKSFGISLMVVGGLVAGYLIHQLGCLFVVGTSLFLQAVSCLLFIIQSWVGHDLSILVITIGVESFASGMASTAFIAMITTYCKSPFSAGHFTFLYAVGSLSRVIVSLIAGITADWVGWSWLFFLTGLTTVPAFWFLILVKRTTK